MPDLGNAYCFCRPGVVERCPDFCAPRWRRWASRSTQDLSVSALWISHFGWQKFIYFSLSTFSTHPSLSLLLCWLATTNLHPNAAILTLIWITLFKIGFYLPYSPIKDNHPPLPHSLLLLSNNKLFPWLTCGAVYSSVSDPLQKPYSTQKPFED